MDAVLWSRLSGDTGNRHEHRGINELLTAECGWLIEGGDVAALARNMAEVLEHPNIARARGQRGRSKMAAYDLQNIISLHDALYAEAPSHNRQARPVSVIEKLRSFGLSLHSWHSRL